MPRGAGLRPSPQTMCGEDTHNPTAPGQLSLRGRPARHANRHMADVESTPGSGPGPHGLQHPRGHVPALPPEPRPHGSHHALVSLPLLPAGWAAFGPDFTTMLVGVPGDTPLEIPGAKMAGIAAYASLRAVRLLAVSGAIAGACVRSVTGSNVSIGHAY